MRPDLGGLSSEVWMTGFGSLDSTFTRPGRIYKWFIGQYMVEREHDEPSVKVFSNYAMSPGSWASVCRSHALGVDINQRMDSCIAKHNIQLTKRVL